MTPLSSLCAVLAAVIAAIGILTAPDAAAQQARGERAGSVKFRVTRFDPGQAPPPAFRAGTERRMVEFKVPLTHIAGPFEAGLRDGVFLDLWTDGAERPAHSIRMRPGELQHLLLVFLPEEDNFRIMKVQTPPDRLRGGDRLLINVTPNELAIKLGDMQPVMVPSTKSAVLKAPGGNEIISLPVLISMKHEDQWTLASTEQWPFDPRFRRYLFAYICPRNRHLMFHGVSERP